MLPDQRFLLLIHLIRDIDTLRAASQLLTDEVFDRTTEIFELACWTVAKDNFKRWGRVVPKDFFNIEVRQTLLEKYPYHGLTTEDIDARLSAIFDYSGVLDFQFASKLLHEFALARLTAPLVQDMLAGTDLGNVIQNMHNVFQQTRVNTATPSDLDTLGCDLFGDMERTPTGCMPIDMLMGGIRFDETIGILGPMKGGKTSLCHSLACDWIKQKPGENRVTFISYEEPTTQQYSKLLISYMNKHHRNKLEGKSLNTVDPSIREELTRAHKYLSAGLTLVDMSGSTLGQGAGGPAELISCMDKLQRTGKLGQIVIVDHALPLVTNYMGIKGLDPAKHTRFQLQELCTQFNAAANRLGVAGVLAHQMDQKGNGSPTRKPSHMDSSECKHFAMMLHHTMCLGMKDASDTAYLNLSCTRSLGTRSIMVKISGWKCRVEPATGLVVDGRTGKFISQDEAMNGKVPEDEYGMGSALGPFGIDNSSSAPPMLGGNITE